MSRLLDAARREPVPSLPAHARERIGRELSALGPPRRRVRWMPFVIAGACACAAAAAIWLRPRTSALVVSPVATQEIVVPACGVIRLAEPGRFSAAIVGPARVTLAPRAQVPFVIHEGRLVARAQERLPVETPSGRVESQAGGIDVEVHEGRPLRVSGFSGEAQALIDATDPIVPSCTPPPTEVVPPPIELPAAPKHAAAPPQDVPPPVAPPMPSTAPPASDPEVQSLAEAIRLARQAHEPDAALARLEEYGSQFPKGALTGEAMVVRVEILMSLGRSDEALLLLEKAPLTSLPRPRELLVLRAELRAEHSNWFGAERDFTAALAGGDDAIGDRALWGRASSRARHGDVAGARADLASYLERFPRGRFVDAARRALIQP